MAFLQSVGSGLNYFSDVEAQARRSGDTGRMKKYSAGFIINGVLLSTIVIALIALQIYSATTASGPLQLSSEFRLAVIVCAFAITAVFVLTFGVRLRRTAKRIETDRANVAASQQGRVS